MNFDIRTAILGLAVGNLVFGLMLELFQFGPDRPQRIPFLAPGKLLQGIGWLLLYERGLIPDWLSFTVGNISLIIGTAYDTWAMYGISQQRVSGALQMSSAAGIIALCVLATPLSAAGKVAVTSFTVMIFFALGGRVMLRYPRGNVLLQRHVGWSMWLMVAVMSVRGTWAALASEHFTLFAGNMIQLIMFATLYYLMLTNGFGMLLLAKGNADHELRDSEARFRSYFELPLIGITITSQDKGWLDANAKLCDMLGYTKDELMAMTWAELTHPDDLSADLAQFNRVLADEIDGYDLEKRFIGKDGRTVSTHLATQCVRHPDRSVHYVVALLEDITERKQAVADLARARDAAEAATHAKSAFLASMSHEIRTPLNAVIGMAALLQNTELTDEQRVFTGTIHTGGQALLSVINDILDFSRIESGHIALEPAPFDLHACLTSAVDLMAHSARQKGLALTWTCDSCVPQAIVGDHHRLRQVLLNLLGNAVKFTSQGVVMLHATTTPQGLGASLLTITVRDTGIGMTAAQVSRIFAPFVQADISTARRYGGSGLGLAISQQLVALMGGTISAESAPGVGSVFTVAIPVAHTAPVDLPRPAPAPELGAPRPLRVLVAEDNPTNQLVVRHMLARLGHMVTVVEDGQAAVDAVTQQPYDVVLMDMQMPVLDGEAATQQIRQRAAAVAQPHIIALTASALDEDRERVLRAGMDGYLSKPVRPEDLQQALAGVTPGAAALHAPDAGAPRMPKTEPLIKWTVLDRLQTSLGPDEPEIIKLLVGLFAEAIPPQLDMIAAALANNDWQQINRDAHRIRGSCLQIGALEMAALCHQLEHADHIDEAAIFAPQLRTCYDATLALLRQRYSHV